MSLEIMAALMEVQEELKFTQWNIVEGIVYAWSPPGWQNMKEKKEPEFWFRGRNVINLHVRL